jgi:hypothetical protein
MTYTVGTELGRLREMISDTDADNPIFSDSYLNDLLAIRESVPQAAAAALRRLIIDPQLIAKKFSGMGNVNASTYATFARAVQDLITNILEGSDDIVEASPSESAIPEADTDESGRATDSDGLYVTGDLDTYISELGTKR